MNFWRDLPAGDKPPELLNMVIEVTSGSRDKYEYSLKWEGFVFDRIIPTSVVFPWSMGLFRNMLRRTATLRHHGLKLRALNSRLHMLKSSHRRINN
jgi:hypothetical protein